MLGLPNLPDVWRVLKEADLNKLRREAERPFQVLLVAEDVRDAERLGVLLSGPEATRHPWLLPADPAEARRAAGSATLDLAVALSPTPDPSPALAFAIDALRENDRERSDHGRAQDPAPRTRRWEEPAVSRRDELNRAMARPFWFERGRPSSGGTPS